MNCIFSNRCHENIMKTMENLGRNTKYRDKQHLYRYIFLFLEINPLSNGRKKSGLKPSGRNLPPLRRGLKPVAPMLLQK